MLLNLFKELHPNFKEIQQASIKDDDGNDILWRSIVLNNDGTVISGGSSSCPDESRIIALSEGFESGFVNKIKSDHELSKEFLTDEHPYSGGFAFGFDSEKTMMRSLCEASERWVRSQWIDKHKFIEKVDIKKESLSKLCKHFCNQFDHTDFYHKKFNLILPNDDIIELQMGITTCFKNNGVFSGQKVTFLGNDVWDHAIGEAWSHYYIFNKSSTIKNENHTNSKRIVYFGENKHDAILAIKKSVKDNWSTPKIRLLKHWNCGINGFHIWRSLCDDFLPEHSGGVTRFVY